MALASTPAYADARDITHFIGGSRVEATAGRNQAVYNPATGQVARQLQLGSVADVDKAVAAAQAAFPAWADAPPLLFGLGDRGQCLELAIPDGCRRHAP